jgi:hypothetical protein
MNNELIETNTVVDFYIAEQKVMRQSIQDLTDQKITLEHVITIVGSYCFYQSLLESNRDIDLHRIKRKATRLLNLSKELQDEILSSDVCIFTRLGLSLDSLFSHVNRWEIFNQILHHKNGGLFNNAMISKHAYFTLLFIGETLGIKPPTLNYQSNDLKTFLGIMLKPFKIAEKTLEYYYQQYTKAKQQPHVKDAIAYLIETCTVLNTKMSVDDWRKMIDIYKDHIECLLTLK